MARKKLGDRSARHDQAYRRAKEENYAGRAVYKLEEIDKRFRLLKRGAKVLDLGCWPGSWLQYAAKRVGEDGALVGIDLKPVGIALPDNVVTIEGDVELLKPSALARKYGPFDVVLSDMAPHTTGDRGSDQFKSEELFIRALEIATATLRTGGHFAAKLFQGPRFGDLVQEVRRKFQETKPFRPQNTRSGSIEQYVVGRGLKAGISPSGDGA
jgi:23S rRNA (uridine2552-2'-O)-methyltransferase